MENTVRHRQFLGLAVLLICLFSTKALAKEELVVVSAVSSSKQTFIIQKGALEGISVGLESLFSTQNASLLARAIEVTSKHSLWQLKERRAVFPFAKDEIITFNKDQSNIWNELPDINSRVAKVTRRQQELQEIYGGGSQFQLRGNLSSTFYESTTDTDSVRTPERTGTTIEVLYQKRMFERLEFGAGVRYDSENAVITDPDLTIPSQRMMGIFEVTYHFSDFDGKPNNFYTAAAVGIGRSQTEIDSTVSTGVATLLPSLRFGYIMRRAQGLDFTFDTVVEALSATESFIDTKQQTTNLVNAKFAVGIRF